MSNDIKSNMDFLTSQMNNLSTIVKSSQSNVNNSKDHYNSTTLCPQQEPTIINAFLACYNEVLNKINDEIGKIKEIGAGFETLDNVMSGYTTKLGMEVKSQAASSVSVNAFTKKPTYEEVTNELNSMFSSSGFASHIDNTKKSTNSSSTGKTNYNPSSAYVSELSAAASVVPAGITLASSMNTSQQNETVNTNNKSISERIEQSIKETKDRIENKITSKIESTTTSLESNNNDNNKNIYNNENNYNNYDNGNNNSKIINNSSSVPNKEIIKEIIKTSVSTNSNSNGQSYQNNTINTQNNQNIGSYQNNQEDQNNQENVIGDENNTISNINETSELINNEESINDNKEEVNDTNNLVDTNVDSQEQKNETNLENSSDINKVSNDTNKKSTLGTVTTLTGVGLAVGSATLGINKYIKDRREEDNEETEEFGGEEE